MAGGLTVASASASVVGRMVLSSGTVTVTSASTGTEPVFDAEATASPAEVFVANNVGSAGNALLLQKTGTPLFTVGVVERVAFCVVAFFIKLFASARLLASCGCRLLTLGPCQSPQAR